MQVELIIVLLMKGGCNVFWRKRLSRPCLCWVLLIKKNHTCHKSCLSFVSLLSSKLLEEDKHPAFLLFAALQFNCICWLRGAPSSNSHVFNLFWFLSFYLKFNVVLVLSLVWRRNQFQVRQLLHLWLFKLLYKVVCCCFCCFFRLFSLSKHIIKTPKALKLSQRWAYVQFHLFSIKMLNIIESNKRWRWFLTCNGRRRYFPKTFRGDVFCLICRCKTNISTLTESGKCVLRILMGVSKKK